MATVILPAARSCFSSSASAGFPTLLHHFFHPSASFIFVTCNCSEIWQVVKRQWSVQHQIRHQPNVVLLNCFVLVIMTESNIPKIVGYSMMSDQSEATGQYAQLKTSRQPWKRHRVTHHKLQFASTSCMIPSADVATRLLLRCNKGVRNLVKPCSRAMPSPPSSSAGSDNNTGVTWAFSNMSSSEQKTRGGCS